MLRATDAQRTRAELALIDLYRADAKLNAHDCWCLGEFFARAFRGRIPRHLPRQCCNVRNAAACAADAIRFVDRAESILRERRRNVWWITWYFERKLRAILCAVLASCPDKKRTKGAPIPHLSLEVTMREGGTEADRMLKSARQMIRIDACRLTTVVEADASCLVALMFRLSQEPDLPRLNLRITSMD